MLQQEDKASKRAALAATLLFHGSILAVLLFFTLKPPYPLPKEVSVEVAMGDLGSTLDGAGQVTPDKIAVPTSSAKQQSQFTAQPIQQTTESARELVTDDSEETPVTTADKPVEKPVDTEDPKGTDVAPQRKVNSRALYGGNTGQPGNEDGGSEGSGEGIGDRGSATGTPGGKGILGNGNGTWELAGRSLVKNFTIATTREEGTVVVKIWVDRRGNVTRVQAGLAGSTTTSEYLFKLAESAALQHKFNMREDAPPEQVGKFTFHFILR